ncbi:MAG: ATP-binding protein [Bacteroidota bacterium]|nr:ATP-binding protein [Bacteroidota bacterium]
MPEDARHSDRTGEFESRTECLENIRLFVSHEAAAFGFDAEDIGKIVLAVDEACTNIIKHAYRNRPDGRIHVRVSSEENRGRKGFVVTILDTGLPFDAAHYRPPRRLDYIRKPRRGGLGIILMKKLMDEVEYSAAPGAPNEIRLVKYLRTHAQAHRS